MKKILLASYLLAGLCRLSMADELPPGEPTYEEIPYYLNKLYATGLEDERIKYNKIIHDAVVNSDLYNKKIVKKLTPLIARINKAIEDNLDRSNLAGQVGWLSSAVAFFNREKLIPLISIPQTDWLAPQQESKDGVKILSFPDRIMVSRNGKNDVLVQSTNIHEAVISPDGRKVAFFRLISGDSPKAEIWVYQLKNKKGKKVAVVPSCYTLLFSLRGEKIFFQEAKKIGEPESRICSVSAGGGSVKHLSEGSLLETLVQTGSRQGCLIIYRKTISHLGAGGQDCAFLFKANGDLLGKLDGPVCK